MSDEHAMLRDALVGRLASHDQISAWEALGEGGVRGLCVPEELGGLGLSAASAAPVMEALGELCIPTPFIETSIIATRLLASARCKEGDAVLRAIAMDGARVAIAGLDPKLRGDVSAHCTGGDWTIDGTARVVLDADEARSFIAIAPHDGVPVVLLLRGWADCDRHSFPTIDGRSAADVTFRQASATLIAEDVAALLAVITDEAIALLAVEAAALMRRLVRDTVSHAKQREQFGQAIAHFQVVQHRLVDMHIQARRAEAIARRAMAALTATEAERARVVSAAKVTIAQAGRYIAQQAVQLHGGMGMTMELIVGRCFKRLTVIEGELGSTDDHLHRYAATSAS